MQKADINSSDGTAADSEQKDEGLFVCQHSSKPDVSGSATPNFLKVAVDQLLTYRTPKKIIDYIEAENMKSIIGNPPFDVSGHYR